MGFGGAPGVQSPWIDVWPHGAILSPCPYIHIPPARKRAIRRLIEYDRFIIYPAPGRKNARRTGQRVGAMAGYARVKAPAFCSISASNFGLRMIRSINVPSARQNSNISKPSARIASMSRFEQYGPLTILKSLPARQSAISVLRPYAPRNSKPRHSVKCSIWASIIGRDCPAIRPLLAV